MITESIVKKEFVRQILKRDSDYIREVQTKVIEDNKLINIGSLLLDVRGQSGTKILQGAGMHMLTVKFLKYLRFIDIKSNSKKKPSQYVKINIANNHERLHKYMPLRRNLALYNRVIFGRLYNETRTDIGAGYTEAIRKNIREQLEKAGYEQK